MNHARKLAAAAVVFILSAGLLKAQTERFEEAYMISGLRENAKISSEKKNTVDVTFENSSGKKSPALAALYSIILPGAGHWYLDRMDVGKYFLGADAISWTGLIVLNLHGDNVRDDARSYSVEHAQVTDPESRNNDYYANVGSYNSIYDYNNDKLSRGEYSMLYDVNTQFWNWDTKANRDIFEAQRKKSERIYNNRVVFSSLLIVNRIASGISAFLIAKNTGKAGGFSLIPSMTYKKDLSFDGFRMNFTGHF